MRGTLDPWEPQALGWVRLTPLLLDSLRLLANRIHQALAVLSLPA